MKLLRYIILLVMALLLVAGILWARDKGRREVCKKVYVEIENHDSTTFVTAEGVMSEIEAHGLVLKGLSMKKINTDSIERLLTASQYFESVDCIVEPGGVVRIKVRQIVPVLRVFEGDDSYYVNKAGKRMKADAKFHADVPIVKGPVPAGYDITGLLPLTQYVENDSVLNDLVTMYCVTDTNNIIIVPSIYGHVINVGNGKDYEKKFAKLRLFYRKVMPKRGWNTFDTISVKWDHQVVATRKNKAVNVKVSVEDGKDNDEPIIDIEEEMRHNREAFGAAEPARPDNKPAEQKPKAEAKKPAPAPTKKEAAANNSKPKPQPKPQKKK